MSSVLMAIGPEGPVLIDGLPEDPVLMEVAVGAAQLPAFAESAWKPLLSSFLHCQRIEDLNVSEGAEYPSNARCRWSAKQFTRPVYWRSELGFVTMLWSCHEYQSNWLLHWVAKTGDAWNPGDFVIIVPRDLKDGDGVAISDLVRYGPPSDYGSERCQLVTNLSLRLLGEQLIRQGVNAPGEPATSH